MKRVFTTIFNQIASITLTIIILSAISLLIGLQLATPKLQAVFKGSRWITVQEDGATFWMVSEVIGGRDVDNVVRILTDALTRHFKKPKLIRGGSGIHALIAVRGRYTPLAFYLAHLTILTLVIGVIISLRGFTYYIDMAEGQVIDPLAVLDNNRHEKKFDFALRCEDFSTIYYEGTNTVLKHQSTLSIVEDGKKVKTQMVDYGTPLNYETIDIYQNRFVNRIQLARIQVITPQGDKQLYEVKNGEIFQLPGNNISIRAAAFRPNSLQLLSLNSPDRLWISLSPVRFFNPALSGYQFSLFGYTFNEMTNLKVIYDPGKGIVWYSFLSMIAGFSIMFFFSHRRLWAIVEEQTDEYVVKLGGSTTKDPQSIRKTIEAILHEVKERTT
ncbi:MAG: cytochrome c biogenesis protein ResB [Proteobacteria bacterium]|nr:cytochrome c biogenesis protein ResB [Pseudomonadota bacterium]